MTTEQIQAEASRLTEIHTRQLEQLAEAKANPAAFAPGWIPTLVGWLATTEESLRDLARQEIGA